MEAPGSQGEGFLSTHDHVALDPLVPSPGGPGPSRSIGSVDGAILCF